MNEYLIFKLLHVASVAFFAGSLLAVILVQSLVQRSLDDVERKHLVRTSASIANLLVRWLARLGLLTGLVFWVGWYGRMAGGSLMARTPVYVHTMLLLGILAVGMTEAWGGNLKRLSQGLDAGKPFTELRKLLSKAWVFAFLALFFVSSAFAVAILKVPSHSIHHSTTEQSPSP